MAYKQLNAESKHKKEALTAFHNEIVETLNRSEEEGDYIIMVDATNKVTTNIVSKDIPKYLRIFADKLEKENSNNSPE